MEVTTKIYLLKDSHGNKYSATVEDSSNYAQICGLKNKDGAPVYFESEAYHLPTFCYDNNISLKVIDTKQDFDTLWDETPGLLK